MTPFAISFHISAERNALAAAEAFEHITRAGSQLLELGAEDVTVEHNEIAGVHSWTVYVQDVMVHVTTFDGERVASRWVCAGLVDCGLELPEGN